jgi:two-component system, response regulator PdtaR
MSPTLPPTALYLPIQPLNVPPLDVLIVEDDALVALDEADIVRSFGDRVIGVADEAEDAYRLAAGRPPTLALLDVNLADGRTGPEICAELIETYRLAVVFVTGNPELLPESFAGALGCIVKPYAASTLGETLAFVRRYLANGSTDRPPHHLMRPRARLH